MLTAVYYVANMFGRWIGTYVRSAADRDPTKINTHACAQSTDVSSRTLSSLRTFFLPRLWCLEAFTVTLSALYVAFVVLSAAESEPSWSLWPYMLIVAMFVFSATNGYLATMVCMALLQLAFIVFL